MDMVMDAHDKACLSRDEKSSPPRPATRDNYGDDILLDTYFDHSQPLDSSALDELLETNFDDDESTSTKTITAKWRPAFPEAASQLQLQQPLTTKMESFDYHDSTVSAKPSPSDHGYLASQTHMYGPSVNATNSYHALPTRMYPPSPHAQQTMALQSQAVPISMSAHFNQGQYFAGPSPVALPTMNDLYHDMSPQAQRSDYHSPDSVSLQGTADLMDYDNAILEEDEAGENANGEAVDPCYAQLLWRCLRDAPEHTMALKHVYEWVRQHSQKARDSTGTGWQNSVRHNLSMNAAFERVTSSALHGPKKGSLWRLTNRALQEGVISTTRYRKDPKRKPERRSSPALKRQISGAKGGQATRAASAHRRAMLARNSGAPNNFNGIERYRLDRHNQDMSIFTPTSMPNSNRATASPQPSWMPQGLAGPMTQHTSLPPSPYYLPSTEADSFAMPPPQNLSNPHTPNEILVGYAGPSKAMASPSTAFDSPSKGLLTEFELSFHDQAMGLFGDHDGFDPNTPSLGTEMSFGTDEMTPASM